MIRILFFLILLANLSFSNNSFKSAMLLPDTLDKKFEIRDEWFSKDKGMHFAGSFISTGLIIMSGSKFLDYKKEKSKVVSVSLTFSLTLGKEIYDSQQLKNHFSYKDLAADMLGIVVAILVFK